MAEPVTTPEMVAVFEATHPQLSALAQSVAPHAARLPARTAPPRLVADANALLAATCRIVSREPAWRGRLLLSTTPVWAELDAKLRLALAACQAFKSLHFFYDQAAGDYAWRLVPTAPPRRRDRSHRTLLRRTELLFAHNLTALETAMK